jgi:5-methylcytosine-specific restriction protein B
LYNDGDGLPFTEINTKVFSQQSIYEMDTSTVNRSALSTLMSRQSPSHALHHVLIIDEINRGNVARIFGELITLIEPQRRLGSSEETRVQLTYSQHHFGVPANLFIIGTMNTADRSIAFLDSALRRRFHFIEVPPNPELIERHVGSIDGFSMADLLVAFNRRLAVLRGEEHLLGHSYFLAVESLKDLQRMLIDQIIPLLREQFHGDDYRWCQALACPFDPDSARQENVHPVLLSEHVELGGDTDPRVRVRINPDFVTASGTALHPYLAALLR